MQNQNKSDYPRARAVFSRFTLVQFDRENFFLLNQEELQNAGIKPEPDLPNFAPDKHKKLLNGISVDKVKNRQVQTYGTRNLEVFIFTVDGKGDDRIWLSKSAFAEAVKDASGKTFKSSASTLSYNEWKAKEEESHQDKDDTVMADDCPPDDCPPIQSVEAQNPNKAPFFLTKTRDNNQTTSEAKRISGNRNHFWTHDGSPGESGETPEPRDDGQVIYGLRCTFGKATLRGLVFRGDGYEFEKLSNCRSELMIPNQNGGMAPKVDNLFVAGMNKSYRSQFTIKGCAAKWHGRPDKQVLVILKIDDQSPLKKTLRQRRLDNDYQYDGYLVCSLSTYRAIFGEDDIPELEEYLRMTEFATSATEEEISLKKGGKKQPKDSLSTKELRKDIQALQNIVKGLVLTMQKIHLAG
ncbi:hypothetical protein Alg130_10806 [Pyrenophora tritici-repentis]|nr:hypothetical protein Alg130_10806 [Pyrenophora tritici-repentis]